jgi:iron complex outermembrane recepter protein
MRRIPFGALALLCAVLAPGQAPVAEAAEPVADSLRHYWLRPITVQSQRPGPGLERTPLDGAPVERALQELGAQSLRRGGALTGDVVAGAFKRADIEILIDGERHPNACPNRMDNASTRLNPAEMASLELLRSCCTASCGLGGVLEYHRRPPAQELLRQVDLQASALAGSDQALALAVEKSGLRLSGRSLRGQGYTDGEGRKFEELYPYSAAAEYRADELSLAAVRGDWALGGSWSLSEDIPFPYLRMDERETVHLAAHLAWRGNKLYANRTEHLMDNGLRMMNGQPLAAPTMVSDATNNIIGLSGVVAAVDYHLSHYRWDLRNHFNTPNGRLENRMIPDLSQTRVEAQRSFELGGPWSFSLRGALVLDRAGDGERVDEMQGRLFGDPEHERLFLLHGLALQWRFMGGGLSGALLLESAAADPGLESLWIGVRKPMGAWWIGNPDLNAALRHTLRGRVYRGPLSLELGLSHVADYAELTRSSFALTDSTRQAVESYRGVEAHLVEAQARWSGRWFETRASFVWGQNLDDEGPLAEISPPTLESTLHSPWAMPGGLQPWLRHTWTGAQSRVSAVLNESPTGAWNRFDLGLSGALGELAYSLELENLLDYSYSQHLSYLRNPFSAGMPVLEPGRSLRLRLNWTR